MQKADDYNSPTNACYLLCIWHCIGSMLGPHQERHLRLHHLRIGESWANGWANSRAHGWDAGEKFDQRGTGNRRPFTPFGAEVSPCRSSLNFPGQCRSRGPVWRAFLNMFNHVMLTENKLFIHRHIACIWINFHNFGETWACTRSCLVQSSRLTWAVGNKSKWYVIAFGQVSKGLLVAQRALQRFDATWNTKKLCNGLGHPFENWYVNNPRHGLCTRPDMSVRHCFVFPYISQDGPSCARWLAIRQEYVQ